MSALGGDRPTRVVRALAFLEGGGRIDLASWLDLGPEDQDALQAAGRALAVQQAARIGQAGSDLGLLAVRAETDPEAAAEHDQVLVAAAVRGASEGLRGRRGE